MDSKEHVDKLKRLLGHARVVIEIVIILVLAMEIVGFAVKWGSSIVHPEQIIDSFHDVTNDLFTILVTYEIFDLLYTRSPVRLMDIVLLAIARKIVLSLNEQWLVQSVFAFAILLLVRLVWLILEKLSEKLTRN